MPGDNPFRILGLPTRADLSDDDVRAAWRRIASATHPDRADGGDSARFAAAAAAYEALRTTYGRGEAYADLHGVAAGTAVLDWPGPPAAANPGFVKTSVRDSPLNPAQSQKSPRRMSLLQRLCNGRPIILAVRILIGLAVCLACVAAVGWQPATLAIAVSVFTWIVLTGRHDVLSGG
jgi:hypothetical protein